MNKAIKKFKQIPAPVKAAFFYTICSFVQKGIALLTTPIFTRILSTEQYGVYSVYQSWYGIVIIFCTLYVNAGAFSTGAIKYEDDRNSFVSSLQGLTTTITLLCFAIYYIFRGYFNQITELSTLLTCAMFIEILFVSAYLLWAEERRFEYKYKSLIVVTIFIAIANPVLGIAAVLSTSYKAEARILSMVLIQVIVGAILYLYNLKKGKKFFSKTYWKFALTFSIPLVPHYLSETILQQADRIMINKLVGTHEAAIYSVAYTISMLMLYIANAIHQSLTPYIYTSIKKKQYGTIAPIVNTTLLIMGAGCICVSAFGPEIIKFFATEEYYSAIYIIPAVSCAVFFMFVYNIYCKIEMYYEKTKVIMYASGFVAILNIVTNYIFIKMYGFIAAGYTTLFCYVVFSFIHYITYEKVIAEKQIASDIYDNRFVLIISIIVLCLSIFMAFIYDYDIIRYVIFGAVVVFLWLKRKVLFDNLKLMKSQKNS